MKSVVSCARAPAQLDGDFGAAEPKRDEEHIAFDFIARIAGRW